MLSLSLNEITFSDIAVLIIVTAVIVLLILLKIKNNDNTPKPAGYYVVCTIFNIIICFLGYFINQFAFIQIFGDPGGYWGGGTTGTILFGLAVFLIISLIDIAVNTKIYRRWIPDGGCKNIDFWLPLCAYVFFDVFLPIKSVFL